MPPESMIAVAAPRVGSPFSPKTGSIKKAGTVPASWLVTQALALTPPTSAMS